MYKGTNRGTKTPEYIKKVSYQDTKINKVTERYQPRYQNNRMYLEISKFRIYFQSERDIC